jgi:osmotically-inducible protein OsmY
LLKFIVELVFNVMSENKEGGITEEARKEQAKDYYAGYYWGNDPYSSSEMPGRKSDDQLKSDILAKFSGTDLSQIQVSVKNGVVTLTGSVKDYDQKRKAGAEAWRTPGIMEVLNDLQVTDPDTAGPPHRD